jgi:hypothetical protein
MTDTKANKVHSVTFDNTVTEYYEISPLSNIQESPSIMPSDQALELLDQIIETADEVDAEYKKEMNESPKVKDWEQSFGEGWMPFHLKKLKELLMGIK